MTRSARSLAVILLLAASDSVETESGPVFRHIEQYTVYFGTVRNPVDGYVFTLRRFSSDAGAQYLTFNPDTLLTAVRPAQRLIVDELPFFQFRQLTERTPYGAALVDELARDRSLLDAGLTRKNATDDGINLTVDLCPSTRTLVKSLFIRVIDVFAPEERPVPVSIAITAVWMQEHPTDLAWLRQLEQDGQLRITWVNHSFHHRYDPKLPLPENFLLETRTSIDTEVLGNEQAMLERGLTPSIFFRFPGLVSNRAVFDQITRYGLLPLGSDAWLAKGQTPRQGSIVLIHGNGNDPVGVAQFMRLLSARSPLIYQRHWLLLDLPKSVRR